VEVVLGGQDGLVNVVGVLLGVAAATSSTRIVLAAGLAAALAESVSMAAVAYTSAAAARDQYQSELEREYRHVATVPNLERAEIRAIYAARGFSGELLDRIVETITANEDVWVAVMMSEEHGLAHLGSRSGSRSALVVGAASLAGSLVPLLPFLFLPAGVGAWASLALAAVVLFAFGAYKAWRTVGRPLRGGLGLALVGTLSALVGFGVGALFRVPGG